MSPRCPQVVKVLVIPFIASMLAGYLSATLLWGYIYSLGNRVIDDHFYEFHKLNIACGGLFLGLAFGLCLVRVQPGRPVITAFSIQFIAAVCAAALALWSWRLAVFSYCVVNILGVAAVVVVPLGRQKPRLYQFTLRDLAGGIVIIAIQLLVMKTWFEPMMRHYVAMGSVTSAGGHWGVSSRDGYSRSIVVFRGPRFGNRELQAVAPLLSDCYCDVLDVRDTGVTKAGVDALRLPRRIGVLLGEMSDE